MTQALLALDIGGTQLKYGRVAKDGEVLQVGVCDTLAAHGAADVLLRIEALLEQELAAGPVAGIAISTLGLVDPQHGKILGAAGAIPDYAGVELGARLQQRFNLPVSVENDVKCVALAEGWRGAAQGVANYLAVAVGTGIGGGVVLDGHLRRGFCGAAGEWGYMHINGVCWEDHASARGLVNLARARSGQTDLDGRAIFAAADAGDALMQQVLDEWFDLLATGIANLVYAFNPEYVVVGGGVSGRGEPFRLALQQALDARLNDDFRNLGKIVLASAGNHAGMIGAVRNWLDRYPG